MQRGSDKMSPYRDEHAKQELRSYLTSGRPVRTAEGREPEPPADDDPAVTGPAPAPHPTRPGPDA
ncbi:hypothetical protein ABZZ17_15970 [Streptomyces sp. NPDC006512]|uniref:hypothetical protein n=1 Tax=Streptomyces sp. NPDC006512 TaxID=3154307 RepID=UPI0033B3E866